MPDWAGEGCCQGPSSDACSAQGSKIQHLEMGWDVSNRLSPFSQHKTPFVQFSCAHVQNTWEIVALALIVIFPPSVYKLSVYSEEWAGGFGWFGSTVWESRSKRALMQASTVGR